MIVDDMELSLLGARLANPKLRSVITDGLFTGELAAIMAAPNGQKETMLWVWLATRGVVRQAAEAPLDAIVRTIRANKARRDASAELIREINRLTASDVRSATELRNLTDRIRGLRDPSPPKIVSETDSPQEPNK